MRNDRGDATDFRRHKQDNNTLFIGHLHQILLHLSLNQWDTLTDKNNTSHIFNYLFGYDGNFHDLALEFDF